MLLIMTVRVKATRVVTHAKVQHTAALRMPLCCCPMGRETAQGGPDQGGTGRGEERSAAEFSHLHLSVHTCPPQTPRLRILIPSVHKQYDPGKRAPIPYVPVQDIGCRAGVAGVDSARSSGRRAVGLEAVQAKQALVQEYLWLALFSTRNLQSCQAASLPHQGHSVF